MSKINIEGLGAIIGDIAGSRFEFNNNATGRKDFDLLTKDCFFTDDTVCTVAVKQALIDRENCHDYSDKYLRRRTIRNLQEFCRKYNNRGYGTSFEQWIDDAFPRPYYSCGNGAAMRISPVGFYADDLPEIRKLSNIVTSVTHSHPCGLLGAEAAATAIWYAKRNYKKIAIKGYISHRFYPEIRNNDIFNIDFLQKHYDWNWNGNGELAQNSVPQAIVCFLLSESFEDAIRNAISIGGDSDTIAAITGGIAEAYYGVPEYLKEKVLEYLPDEFIDIMATKISNNGGDKDAE